MVTAPNKVRAVDRSKFFPKGFGKTVNVTKITGDDPQLKVLAFVCAHETSCFTKGSGVELNGSLKFRNEQLKLLGVTPLVVKKNTHTNFNFFRALVFNNKDFIAGISAGLEEAITMGTH